MTAKEIIERLSSFDPNEEVYLEVDHNETNAITVARSNDVGYSHSNAGDVTSPLLTIRAEV